MTDNGNAPATKNDLEVTKSELRAEMKQMKDEIIRHFDVALEQMRHDLAGANQDEIETLKDGKVDHENRIVRLEQTVGLRA